MGKDSLLFMNESFRRRARSTPPVADPHVLRPQAALAQRPSAEAADEPDDGRSRRRDLRLRVAAHRGRRLVCGRRCDVVGAARDAQRDLARVPAAAQLRATHAAGRWRDRRVVGQLVRRRLRQRAQFLPAVRRQRRELSRHVSRIRDCPNRAQGFRRRSAGRRRRAQARRPLRLEDRRPDSASRHDLSRHLDLHAARDLRRRRREDRREPVPVPVGLSQRGHEETLRPQG